MYKVKVTSDFSSAHNLRGYKGKCEGVHGHNWKVEVSAALDTVNNIGMVIDFKDLRSALKEILEDLDHKYLNDLEYFKKNNPTSECLAKYIFEKIRERDLGVKISDVTVWETETASATYSE